MCRIGSLNLDYISDSTCQVPTAWQNKSWYMYRGTGDPNSRAATRRDFVVGVSEIYGMKADGYAAVVQNWTCYYRNTNDNIIAFKYVSLYLSKHSPPSEVSWEETLKPISRVTAGVAARKRSLP